MTSFEIAVPMVAFVVAGVGILLLRRDTRRIDALIEERRRHPAE